MQKAWKVSALNRKKDLSLTALFLLPDRPDGVARHDVVIEIKHDQNLRRATNASVIMLSSTRFPKMEGTKQEAEQG